MTKRKPLKEIIASAIDKRWKKFVALGAESKKLDPEKDRDKVNKIYLKMKELVLDMKCVEHYVLEANPDIKGLWNSLKNLTIQEKEDEDVQTIRNR